MYCAIQVSQGAGVSIRIPGRAVGAPCLDRTAGGAACAAGAPGTTFGVPAAAAGWFMRGAAPSHRGTGGWRGAASPARAPGAPVRVVGLHGRYPQTMVLLHVCGGRPLFNASHV